jgi:capsule polysaccharide export protein KpsE/RkpR
MNSYRPEKLALQSAKQMLSHLNGLFLPVVVNPTVQAGFYFSLIASDIYIFESCFAIPCPEGTPI